MFSHQNKRHIRYNDTIMKPEPNACPSCGSTDVAKYLYGYVALDDELEQQLEEGKIILGGCAISDDAPEYCCNVCGNEW